jgi:molybdopterin-guanine dinucleotide biosynthesis protein A
MLMDEGKDVAGFILAGGRSSRMGRDKALLEIDGATMIERAIDLVRSVDIEPVVVGGAGEIERSLRVHTIADEWPGAGPWGAIATALRNSQAAWNLVIACDLPYLTTDWLGFLLEFGRSHGHASIDAIVPMNQRGPEPLCALYGKHGESTIRAALDSGLRKVTDGLARLRVMYLESGKWKAFDPEGLLFKNMNEPADYEEAKARLSGRAKK